MTWPTIAKKPLQKTILDIGARGGILAMFPGGTNRLLAPILAKEARIIQFEPDTAYRLDRISRHFGCKLVKKAVGLKSGAATLFITRDPYKSSILEPNAAVISESFLGASEQYSVVRTAKVDCVTIKGIIAEYAQNTAIWLKIDAQSVEGDIVRSIGEEISAIKVIIVELSSIKQYRDQVLAQDVIPTLLNAGFSLLFSNYKSEAPYENDFIFIRPNDLTPKEMMHLHMLVGNTRRALALAPNYATRLRLRTLLTCNAVAQTILSSGIYPMLKGLFC